jgi:predicted hotdog family 3-hydroxylacyl-ACP dehydratase
MSATLPPIDTLVPHAPPMLAVERVLDYTPGRATVAMTVRDGLFTRDGRVDSVVLLEYMAQAVAACLGLEATAAGGAVRVGMVVACRSLAVARPSVRVGEELTICVERVRGTEQVSHFDGETRDVAGDVVARTTLTLVHGERPPE